MLQIYADIVCFALVVFEQKSPSGAKTIGGDSRIITEYVFVIGVIANAVLAIAVQVNQYAVITVAGVLLDGVFQRQQVGRERSSAGELFVAATGASAIAPEPAR